MKLDGNKTHRTRVFNLVLVNVALLMMRYASGLRTRFSLSSKVGRTDGWSRANQKKYQKENAYRRTQSCAILYHRFKRYAQKLSSHSRCHTALMKKKKKLNCRSSLMFNSAALAESWEGSIRWSLKRVQFQTR